MSFLNRLFRRTKKAGSVGGEEQAVLVHLDGSSLPAEVYDRKGARGAPQREVRLPAV